MITTGLLMVTAALSDPEILQPTSQQQDTIKIVPSSIDDDLTVTTPLPEIVSRQLDKLQQIEGKRAPSMRSLKLARAAAQLLTQEELKIDRAVSLPEGGVVLYLFGGAPSDTGSHPRHVGIVADNEEDCLSVFMTIRNQPDNDEYFDIGEANFGVAIRRIATFIQG